MSAREFGEWVTYSQMEPFGELRADQRAWLLVAMLANVNREAKSEPIDLTKVLPEWQPLAERSPEATTSAIAAFFDAKIESEGKV